MRNLWVLLTCGVFVLGVVVPAWAQGVLETPPPNSLQSGLGIVSGWKCHPGIITVSFDGGAAIQAAAGTSRADTLSACGSVNNGFGLLFNWNLLGDGPHTAQVFDNGGPFASATFTVTTLGGEFVTSTALINRGACPPSREGNS